MRKYFAELVGTFVLAFVVLLSLAGKFPVSTPVLAGLTLGLFVYSIGHISGCHINPAVTLGAWSICKIKFKDVVGYLVAQLLGGALAFVVAFYAFNITLTLTWHTSYMVAISEAVGMMLFTFGIASVVYGRTPKAASGLVVGGSLLLGIAIAATTGSHGILNPAVALAVKSFSWVYIVGPIVGSVAGFWLFKLVSEWKTKKAKA